MADYYNLLRVPPEAAPEAIRAAFRREAKACHPDAHPTATPEARAALERRFILLAQAYDTLSDPARRLAYDRRAFGRVRGARGGPARDRDSAGKGGAAAQAGPDSRARRRSTAGASGAARGSGAAGKARPQGTAAEPGWDDLLRDVEALLGRFGLDLEQPFERLLEALLDWARALFREVAGAWRVDEVPPGTARGGDGSGRAPRARGRAEPPPGAQAARPTGPAPRGSSRKADPEVIERELAELKRKAGRKD